MTTIAGSDVKKIVIACDAGMGSSALLTSTLRQQLASYDVAVEHSPVNAIPADADVVLCHQGLADRARSVAADKVVLGFQVFLGDPVFERVVAAIRDGAELEG